MALRILEEAGYGVLAASGAQQAIALSASHSIDLLVTDVVMPKMSGPALAARLARSRPGLRVLFLSGYGLDAIEDRGLELESFELLQKPFSGKELVEAVRRVIGS